ncbi:MAG: helix-turn-helix transcriptional regulator [Methanomassiliicoccales archaeon]
MTNENVDQDRLSDLYFQLANEDRRRMIRELLTGSLKLNEVAKHLGITPTEAFRQLQRLTDAGLLEKMPDGRYRSTSYSKLILESADPLAFIAKNREHFTDHNALLIPPEFRARFGELLSTQLLTETVPNLNRGTEAFRRAQHRIDLMVEQRLEEHGQAIRQRADEGVKVRYLMQESFLESIKGEIDERAPKGEVRSIPKICAMLIIIDDSVAIALPRNDGKMDYQLIQGNSTEAVKWAEDLFEDQCEEGQALEALKQYKMMSAMCLDQPTIQLPMLRN